MLKSIVSDDITPLASVLVAPLAICLCFKYKSPILRLSLNLYEIEASGKILSNNTIELKKGYEKSIIYSKSTFTDSNGDFGIIKCLGTLDKFLDKSIVLNLFCLWRNQDNEKFTGKIIRKSDSQEAGVGIFEYLNGSGKYNALIGRKCNLAVRYIDEFSFYRHVCK